MYLLKRAILSHSHLIMNDKGIKEAIERGLIQIDKPIQDSQIQPATLDVRIGKVRIYDQESFAKGVQNIRSALDDDPTIEYAKNYEDVFENKIVIPSKSFLEIFFHEDISFKKEDFDISFQFRSSRGRLLLSPLEEIKTENNQKYVCAWNNNINEIILYGQTPFGQIFFHPKNKNVPVNGYIVSDPEEAREIAKTISLEEIQTFGPYLVFNIGNHILKFNDINSIDTKTKYREEDLYQKISTELPIRIPKRDSIITQLHPELKVPGNIGIKLLSEIPYTQTPNFMSPNSQHFLIENHRVNAGWIDPGYEGFVTAHPHFRKNDVILKKGTPFVFGLMYKYLDAVDREYGSEELGSHYQKSDGTGSRS